MTAADDLRALSAADLGPIVIVGDDFAHEDAELIFRLRNHADALADLIDATAALSEPVPKDWPIGGTVWRRVHERALDRITDALAALDGTP